MSISEAILLSLLLLTLLHELQLFLKMDYHVLRPEYLEVESTGAQIQEVHLIKPKFRRRRRQLSEIKIFYLLLIDIASYFLCPLISPSTFDCINVPVELGRNVCTSPHTYIIYLTISLSFCHLFQACYKLFYYSTFLHCTNSEI